MEKIDRSEMPPARVGGPIDLNKGDQSAHASVQRSDVEQARIESGLGADGNLDPNFDGTQPKILADGTVAVVGMKDLKQASADFDGETVEEQEKRAAEGAANPDNDTDMPDPDAEEEVEDDGNLTVAQLKEALDEAGIAYSSSDRKADLRALYDDNGLGD